MSPSEETARLPAAFERLLDSLYLLDCQLLLALVHAQTDTGRENGLSFKREKIPHQTLRMCRSTPSYGPTRPCNFVIRLVRPAIYYAHTSHPSILSGSRLISSQRRSTLDVDQTPGCEIILTASPALLENSRRNACSSSLAGVLPHRRLSSPFRARRSMGVWKRSRQWNSSPG